MPKSSEKPQPTAPVPVNQNERVMRFPEVKERTGLCRSHIHAMAKTGDFPSPIKLGGRASGWLESEVSAWLKNRIEASRSAQEVTQ